MNAFARTSVCLAAALLGFTGKREAAAQVVVAQPTTSVVAFQPVVVPTSPALISGWYPGKLLDTWAANRLAFRSAAVAAPVATAVPVTSFRPVTGVAVQTAMPVRTFRPLFASPLVPTTVFSPVMTTSSACCDVCSATVTGFAAAPSPCCGASVSDGSFSGEVTSVPQLSTRDDGSSAGYRGGASEAGGTSNGQTNEKSVVEENGEGESKEPGTNPTSWEPPPLRDPRLEAMPEDPNPVARREATPVTEAIYRKPVGTGVAVASGSKASPPRPLQKSIPTRAEREAMWTAVID